MSRRHFHRNNDPGMARGWLHLQLPENPVCWIHGHFPRLRVNSFGSAGRVLKVRCALCDRRWDRDPSMERGRLEQYTERARAQAAAEGLVADNPGTEFIGRSGMRIRELRRAYEEEYIDRMLADPENLLAGARDRSGWAPRETVWHYELVDHKARRTASGREPTPRTIRQRLARIRVGATLHFGNRSSETPIDANVQLGRWAAYVTIGGIGGRFAEWIGRGHKRNLKLETHGGSLWWQLWYDDDGGHDDHHRCDGWRTPRLWPWSAGRRKYRPWMCLRNGNIDLNPADAWWGTPKYLRVPVDVATGLVSIDDFPGDAYPVDFTLEYVERRREHGPAWARRVLSSGFSVDADANPGIPVRNHDWKGDEITGWHVGLDDFEPADRADVPASRQRWLAMAVAGTIELVRRDRKHYSYRPPRPAVVEGSDA